MRVERRVRGGPRRGLGCSFRSSPTTTVPSGSASGSPSDAPHLEPGRCASAAGTPTSPGSCPAFFATQAGTTTQLVAERPAGPLRSVRGGGTDRRYLDAFHQPGTCCRVPRPARGGSGSGAAAWDQRIDVGPVRGDVAPDRRRVPPRTAGPERTQETPAFARRSLKNCH
jgi:hypothetical protein